MRLWPAVLLSSSLALAPAFACPTCVGPRLGDSSSDAPQVHASLRSSFGTDSVDKTERLELGNELSAGIAVGRAAFDVSLPLLWRRIEGTSLTGLGDLAVHGSLEAFRSERPESSDTLRALVGVGLPTSRGATHWLTLLGTQSVTPQVALGWRHSDQGWGLSAIAYAGVPIALPDAAVTIGPYAGAGSAIEYEAFKWLSWRLAFDVKQQWAAREAGVVLPESQFFAGFASVEARAQPARRVGITAGVSAPLWCISPGLYNHGFVYRLALDVTL